ncbi:unnamed protein product [Citrullus colocynthis]|uniref:Uncharacterized protein n=1 Tax=Citrullus colocynthis TaxID=252529 RepID=A0ABP0YS30_9ROSI
MGIINILPTQLTRHNPQLFAPVGSFPSLRFRSPRPRFAVALPSLQSCLTGARLDVYVLTPSSLLLPTLLRLHYFDFELRPLFDLSRNSARKENHYLALKKHVKGLHFCSYVNFLIPFSPPITIAGSTLSFSALSNLHLNL